jgi:hypothetical protein
MSVRHDGAVLTSNLVALLGHWLIKGTEYEVLFVCVE